MRKGERSYSRGYNKGFSKGWKVHRALVLEPYLGFLHSVQEGKPSLVRDFEELYRYLIDDFVIQYCQELKKRDFSVKTEILSRKKTGKREYLNDTDTRDLRALGYT
jgi:CRISPR/Cas system-associated endonuclease Cas1